MIEALRQDFSVNLLCKTLNVIKSTYYRHKNKLSFESRYNHLKETIKKIILNNPKYGYRRIQSELGNKGVIINHKTLRKLLNLWNLNILRKTRKPRPSRIEQILTELGPLANLVKRLTKIKPFQLIYTDFTLIVSKQHKLWLIPFLDHTTKKVIGYSVSLNANTQTAFNAFNKVKRFLKNNNIDLSKIIIHQDQGSVFKSYEYVGELIKNDISLSYSRKARPSTILKWNHSLAG